MPELKKKLPEFQYPDHPLLLADKGLPAVTNLHNPLDVSLPDAFTGSAGAVRDEETNELKQRTEQLELERKELKAKMA